MYGYVTVVLVLGTASFLQNTIYATVTSSFVPAGENRQPYGYLVRLWCATSQFIYYMGGRWSLGECFVQDKFKMNIRI